MVSDKTVEKIMERRDTFRREYEDAAAYGDRKVEVRAKACYDQMVWVLNLLRTGESP